MTAVGRNPLEKEVAGIDRMGGHILQIDGIAAGNADHEAVRADGDRKRGEIEPAAVQVDVIMLGRIGVVGVD